MLAFRKRHYPGVTAREWNDWRWQVRHRIRNLDGLEGLFCLTEEEQEAVRRLNGELPLGITPYYAALMSLNESGARLRKTMIPTLPEFRVSPGERDDPLGEESHSPVPGLIHTYPDKALFLVTDQCATHCRYCTRSRFVGQGSRLTGPRSWESALEYIRTRPAIRDVLLSGGDPLMLSDERLGGLLTRLRTIPHVEFLRIGTKIPAVLPQRITRELTRKLKRHHPLFISIHFTHPAEITAEVRRACARLADAGIPLGSQTVLLSGVNDDLETMRSLMHELLKIRVKPYYLHQCDAVTGSAHFRTSIEKGMSIIKGLHGHTTGYAVPTYMLDAPGGGGKVPLTPAYVTGRAGNEWMLRNYRDDEYRYYDPINDQAPIDRPHNP